MDLDKNSVHTYCKRIVDMMIRFLHSESESHSEDLNWTGIKRSFLSEWYIFFLMLKSF